MPILAEEVSIFPEWLLDEDDVARIGDANGDSRNWWVMYTKARQEKALARQLVRYEIPFYLPLVPKEYCIRGNLVRSFLPLFGGYVFLCASESERVQTLTTNRVSYMLNVDDSQQLRLDLLQISRLIEADAPLTVEKRLQPGQWVRVKYGPFAGMEGTLMTRRGRTRLLVSINFLGQGASIEINDFQVEPA
jgi:transcription antitermination factor NusG